MAKKPVGYKEIKQDDLTVYKCNKCRFQTPHERKIENHFQNKHGYDLNVSTLKPASTKKESD